MSGNNRTELDRVCLQTALMVERGYALARGDHDVVARIDEFISDLGTGCPWCHEEVCEFINSLRGLAV